MPKQQGGNQNNDPDRELAYLVGGALVLLTIWLIWQYGRNVIVWFSFSFDYAQLFILKWIISFGETAQGYMEFIKGVYRPSDHPRHVDPFSVTWEELTFISELAGRYFRWFFAPVILVMALRIMFKMKGAGFSRSFSLAGGFGPSLADFQAQHWKVFTPGAKFDPDKENKVEDPAMTPMEWMRENDVGLSDEIGGLDMDAAHDAFEKQLGAPWEGIEKAPTHVKALAVIFFYNAKRDKSSRDIKEKIAVAYSSQKPDAIKKTVDELFKKAKEEKKFLPLVDKYTSQHAYTNTALFRLLRWARDQGGVLASAEFRWLKPVDRTLWYTLNNTGRRSFHTEGAGAVSHFHSENIVGGPLAEPHVDQAVDGLDDYLEDQGLTDLDAFFGSHESEF